MGWHLVTNFTRGANNHYLHYRLLVNIVFRVGKNRLETVRLAALRPRCSCSSSRRRTIHKVRCRLTIVTPSVLSLFTTQQLNKTQAAFFFNQMCSVIVLYPSGHDFDMDYYLSRHMKTIDE